MGIGHGISALEVVRQMFDEVPSVWLMSSSASMHLRDLRVISEALCAKPVVIDASSMSTTISSRLFWASFTITDT